MTRMPGHLANDRAATGQPTPVDGLDLALAAQTVARIGGDPARFAASFAAGQCEDPDLDAERGLALAAVAAWRAGALALRDDARARLDVLREGDAAGRLAAAAALGLDPGAFDAFVVHQRTDRFWWPGRTAARGYVCAVGGFAGLGGAWQQPPVEGRLLDHDGAFAIRAGDAWWRLDADVWGSRLRPLDGEPPAASASPLTIVCPTDSYLAWIHVKDAA